MSSRIPAAELPTGFSLIPEFLPGARAGELFAELLEQAAWRGESIRMFGREIASPRRVCWYGDAGVGYRYSGNHHGALPWLPQLAQLRQRLLAQTGERFNFVLLNLYRDQNDSMGWHADDESELGAEPIIASISLGAERVMRVRPRATLAGARRRSQPIHLPHGSLLLMRGRSQADFQHAVPKCRDTCGPRVNLTFRRVLGVAPGSLRPQTTG